MNVIRWKLINTLKEKLPNVEVNYTYGSETSKKRKELGFEKTHATDAWCIGNFHPQKRAKTVYYQKIRRNDRRLESFYDAQYIDIRDNSIKSGKDLGCQRTKRNESRNSEKNLRIFHGKKIRK